MFLNLPITTDPPQKVWLEAPPHNVPLHSGTTVRLICFATGGNPAVTLTWYKVNVIYQCVLCCTDTHSCVMSFCPLLE